MYVADVTPTAETSYHARFKFDPNTVTIGSGTSHDIFVATNSAGTANLRLQITKSSRSYQIRTATTLNSGSIKYSNWVTFTDAPHSIEVVWQAAASGSTGSSTLYIDGTQVSSVAGLANSSTRIDSARLGPQSLPSGVSGVEYFDAFASTRTTYIGPLSGNIVNVAPATNRGRTPVAPFTLALRIAVRFAR
jgi:hypothetical protein